MTDIERQAIERLLNGANLIGYGYFDNAGRWYPKSELKFMVEYCKNYRPPSRRWQYSYLRACSTKKFLKYVENLALKEAL